MDVRAAAAKPMPDAGRQDATLSAIHAEQGRPALGATPLDSASNPPPAGARAVTAEKTGYVVNLDIASVSAVADSLGPIRILARPGTFVHTGDRLALVTGGSNGEDWDMTSQRIRHAFIIAKDRSFDQDPRFGISVMAEIGSRALSAGMDDSGTAIETIGHLSRMLETWAEDRSRHEEEPLYPSLFVERIQPQAIFEDAFRPIARDGAARLEVQLRLQAELLALSAFGDAAFKAAARRQSDEALARAESGLAFDADKEVLRKFVTERRAEISGKG